MNFHATYALLEDFEIFDNFDHIFKPFSTSKIVYDKYLINQTQLSKKQWGWQLVWTPFTRLKKRKKSI